jgi:hypothetical protein
MKKEYRTHRAKVRQSLYGTGGGPSDEIKSYPFEELMGEILTLSAEGLVNPHDNDRLEPTADPELEHFYSEDEDLELGLVRQLYCLSSRH